jgi:hypothetical protein
MRRQLIDNDAKKLNQYLMQTVQAMKRPNVKYADEFLSRIKATYDETNERDDELKMDLLYPLMIQAQFNLHASNYTRAAEIFVRIFEIYKNVDEANAILSIFEATVAYNTGCMRDEARRCLKMAKDHFIGYTEYFNYICKSKLTEVEDLSDILNSI